MIDTILFSCNISLNFLRSIDVISIFIILTLKFRKCSSSICGVIRKCSWIICKINKEGFCTTNSRDSKGIIICRTRNTRSICRTGYTFNLNDRSNCLVVWQFRLIICFTSIPICPSNKSKVSLLINIIQRNCCWTKIRLNL